jgi:hypothetical protein
MHSLTITDSIYLIQRHLINFFYLQTVFSFRGTLSAKNIIFLLINFHKKNLKTYGIIL